MIHIDLTEGKKDEQYFFGLTVTGHAHSDEPGRDLVCCAVSTLVGTLFATLDEQEIGYESETDEVAGFAEMSVTVGEELMPAVYIMFMTIMIGLIQVADEHPEYVSIHRKETK